MIQSTYGTMYYVDSMAKAVSYYKGMLGLEPGYQSDDWTEFSIGGHNLCLHAKRPSEKYDANGILILAKDGVKAHFEKLQRDGFKVFGLHEIHPAAWTFHAKDESGNEFSFYGKP